MHDLTQERMERRIQELYAQNEDQPVGNVVSLTPPMTIRGEGIMHDVETFLLNPAHRKVAEPVLEHVLSLIASQLMGRPQISQD